MNEEESHFCIVQCFNYFIYILSIHHALLHLIFFQLSLLFYIFYRLLLSSTLLFRLSIRLLKNMREKETNYFSLGLPIEEITDVLSCVTATFLSRTFSLCTNEKPR